MMDNVAAPGGVAVAVARVAEGVAAEWRRGRQWLAPRWARRELPVAQGSPMPANAEELLLGVDPLIAVRWRGSR
ncbi:hypothetical protein DFR70_1021044 [Nocardia tenerifensis]|uniref:Uncharacterized protein n=1 Tax=Nocardia tenerifensis TaxID=228006 RepID=A0A318K8B4_9NOCA|nr:hypothetical protein [Nocardia tenerifensis]PXX69355.1 hypothetical protein DFR70_1021044 [Nocardia tenerifensis]